MKLRLPLLLNLITAACLLLCARLQAEEKTRPNIIFLLTDDQRWDSLGCAGHPVLQTPNIDALAKRGVMMRRHFVTTSICNVSRASILTGQHLRKHGKVNFGDPFTAEEWTQTYPALLRAAGYRTGFIGKFGVGDEKAVAAMEREFDYWRGLPGQGGLFFDKDDATHTHKTARMGDQALEFLRSGTGDRPFCLSVSFNAPHARDRQPREFAPDPRDEALFAETVFPGPRLAGDEWFRRLPESAQKSEGRIRWGWRFDTAEKYQSIMKDYARLIYGIDREVGRITAELEARGLAENTVIFFTGDNGFFHGERGLADKWLMYEESIRTPCIVCDPRLPESRRGVQAEALSLNIDFAPTIAEMAGLAISGAMQGRSLVPVLKGNPPGDWRTDFYYEHRTLPERIPPVEGVRSDGWKYVRWTRTQPGFEELFDLTSDPGEERNLAGDPAQSARLAELKARCALLKEQAGR